MSAYWPLLTSCKHLHNAQYVDLKCFHMCRTSSQRAVLGMSDADLVKECQDILLGAMVGTAVPDIAATTAEGAAAALQSSQQDRKQDTSRSEAANAIQPAAAAVDIMDMETQLLEDLPQAMVTDGTDCSTQLGSFAFPIQQLAGPVDSAKAPVISAIPQAAAGDHAQCDSQSQTAKGEDVQQQQGSGSSHFMLSGPSSLPNMQSVAQPEQHILKAPAYENEQPERHLAEQAASSVPIPAPAVESATPVPKAGKDGSSMNSLLEAMLAGDF